MHRALRQPELDDVHEQWILAPPQSVSGRPHLILPLRMQQLAHLMRLRALTIVKAPGRDRFSTISSLTSSAGGRRRSSEHHVGGADESGST